MAKNKILINKVSKRKQLRLGTDRTTWARFSLQFNEKDYLRTAYVPSCDYTTQMSGRMQEDIEAQVRHWLDNAGLESRFISFSLEGKKGVTFVSKDLVFWRAEIAYKTASNVWAIFHIAQSSFWPRLVSSKPKVNVQFSGSGIYLDNEIKACNYGCYEDQLLLAESLAKEHS